MLIRDMTHDYWLYFEKNYVQKIKKTRKQVKKNDGETRNDGDASTPRYTELNYFHAHLKEKNMWRLLL